MLLVIWTCAVRIFRTWSGFFSAIATVLGAKKTPVWTFPPFPDDGSHIEPALRGPHIREIGNPFAVGSGRLEAASRGKVGLLARWSKRKIVRWFRSWLMRDEDEEDEKERSKRWDSISKLNHTEA